MSVLPDKVLARMDSKDRAALGPAGRTAAEGRAAGERRDERELQRQIESYLRLNQPQSKVVWFCQRMDRKATGRPGTPDFILCYRGRFVAFECKSPQGICSPEQVDFLKQIHAAGGISMVVRRLEEVIQVMQIVEEMTA